MTTLYKVGLVQKLFLLICQSFIFTIFKNAPSRDKKMFYRENRKSTQKFPQQKTKESYTTHRYLCMTETLFELWVERQIDRIDREYMNDRITEEEYNNKMKELNRIEEEFINNLVLENC